MKKRIVVTSLISLLSITFLFTTVFSDSGWVNKGWSGANWLHKACNSKTTVLSSPKFKYMSATAKIGDESKKVDQKNPRPNSSVHAVANGAYNRTCEYWGIAR